MHQTPPRHLPDRINATTLEKRTDAFSSPGPLTPPATSTSPPPNAVNVRKVGKQLIWTRMISDTLIPAWMRARIALGLSGTWRVPEKYQP